MSMESGLGNVSSWSSEWCLACSVPRLSGSSLPIEYRLRDHGFFALRGRSGSVRRVSLVDDAKDPLPAVSIGQSAIGLQRRPVGIRCLLRLSYRKATGYSLPNQ
jgi:hypothetical protein